MFDSILKMRWLGVLLAGLALTTTVELRADDRGQYQILEARYGTSDRNIDVTQRLRELAKRDQRVRVTNGLFGTDPAPQEVKVLRIYARAQGGKHRTFEYIEDSWIDGSQFTAWSSGAWGQGGQSGGWGGSSGEHHNNSGYDRDSGEYQILHARYGTRDRNIDVTPRLRELAREDRRIRVSNDTFGSDPAPQQVKVLRIYARSRDGRNRTFELTEGETVDGNRFTAWRSGNWGQESWQQGWNGHDGGSRPGFGAGLEIVRARYGAEGRDRDIADRLQSRVHGDRLDVEITNDLAGDDPAPNVEKHLSVTYRINGGPERHVRVRENQRLRLP